MKSLKKFIIKSSSLTLSILGIIISMIYINGISIGQYIFKNNIPDGVISIILFLLSIYIGNKKKNKYSSMGSFISKFFLIAILMGIFFTIFSDLY